MIYALKFVCVVSLLGKASAYPAEPSNTTTATSDNEDKIVGGYTISITNAPYQVYLRLQKGNKYFQCGGSILNSRYILTAAHCLVGVKKVFVRIGSGNSDSGGNQYSTTTFKSHPKYNSRNYDFDVAYVRTNENMKIDGKNSKAVKLPNANWSVNPGTELFVTGWGTTRENGATSRRLQAVKVPVVSTADCKKSYGKSKITNRMVCAGFKNGGKDSCQGDSGGPAVSNSYQHGIVSFGNGCARKKYPGVYTKVSDGDVRQWIKSNTGV